jgi:hypothetical protein
VILQLQFALFQSPQLQLFVIHVARQYLDDGIEVAMFDFEFDDAAPYVFPLRHRHDRALAKKGERMAGSFKKSGTQNGSLIETAAGSTINSERASYFCPAARSAASFAAFSALLAATSF